MVRVRRCLVVHVLAHEYQIPNKSKLVPLRKPRNGPANRPKGHARTRTRTYGENPVVSMVYRMRRRSAKCREGIGARAPRKLVPQRKTSLEEAVTGRGGSPTKSYQYGNAPGARKLVPKRKSGPSELVPRPKELAPSRKRPAERARELAPMAKSARSIRPRTRTNTENCVRSASRTRTNIEKTRTNAEKRCAVSAAGYSEP
jgi:hypothetical protein